MQRKYFVTSNKNVDIATIDKLVNDVTNIEYIPDRNVEIIQDSLLHKRISVYALTDNEAERLQKHEAIYKVELHISERDDISAELHAVATDNYRRTQFDDNELGYANYGLVRHTSREQFLYDDAEVYNNFNNSYIYNNAGEGVDIFIMDMGVEADHPDFVDEYGVSRVQKIDWRPIIKDAGFGHKLASALQQSSFEPDYYYQEQESFHGTQCASIAAGNKYGWAKKAHIYSIKHQLGFDNSGYPQSYEWFQIIKFFIESQRAKGINRPAIINNSWGFSVSGFSVEDIIGGSYADENTTRSSWARGTQTDAQIKDNYRVIPSTQISIPIDSIELFIDDLVDMGVHFVNSASNWGHRIVPRNDPEYDNFITTEINGVQRQIFYNRAGYPIVDNSTCCGAIKENLFLSDGNKNENIATYSNRGKRIDILASAEGSFCAASKTATGIHRLRAHPDDATRKIHTFGGTSCASPQTAGVMALHLSHNPNLSPTALRDKIKADATKDIIYNIGGYNDVNSFHDTPNNFLYSPFNQDHILRTTGTFFLRNASVGHQHRFKTNFRSDNVIFRTNGVGDDNDGYFVDNNTSNVYENSTIRYLKIWQQYGRTIIELVFDAHPDKMKNHSWNILEINGNANIKLHRSDAIFDKITQTFRWDTGKYTLINTPTILINSVTPQNILGLI